MELVRKVDDTGALTKEKEILINQPETKVQYFEEEKHQIEAHCCKAMRYMDCMKAEKRILVSKFDMSENHSLGEIHNLASERQIKQFIGTPCIEITYNTMVNCFY